MGRILKPNLNIQNEMNKYYVLHKENGVNFLSYVLNNDSFLQNLKNLFRDKAQYIINLRKYPFDIKTVVSTLNESPIILGDTEATATFTKSVGGQTYSATYTAVGRECINIDAPVFDMGSFTIPKRFNNFLDYAPYTKIELWLPYLGFVQLDPNVVVGVEIKIEYVISLVNGNTTIYLSYATGNKDIIYTATTNIGIDIPFNFQNFTQANKDTLSGVLGVASGLISVGGGVASSNALATLGGVVKLASATSSLAVNSNQPTITKGVMQDSVGMWYAPQKPYLIVTTPLIVDDNYSSLKGKPSGEYLELNELTGFTKVESVHLENFNDATQNEIDEIETLLKGGVIL